MTEELWKDISYADGYRVNSFGEVLSLKTNKRLKQRRDKDGYQTVGLMIDGKQKLLKVHRLVAQAFIENPNNYPIVNHKDKNRANNNANNLEWCTVAYNNQYSRAKSVNQYTRDGVFIKQWGCIREAERQTGCHNRDIIRCCKGINKTCKGYIWKYADKTSLD